ncbi:hypothetical protein WICMUC_002621 [Wickerhamomyces mucosus]|uniref:SWI/SNF complex subunit SWI3 n=1 Tax=Wickerhamomyces mucosus TaxID=1378264 RepID=A0A9P8PP83_9ASCO|nr:hypothetical protein WICMUC_002621 [Wickerhamomyces mucosus]
MSLEKNSQDSISSLNDSLKAEASMQSGVEEHTILEGELNNASDAPLEEEPPLEKDAPLEKEPPIEKDTPLEKKSSLEKKALLEKEASLDNKKEGEGFEDQNGSISLSEPVENLEEKLKAEDAIDESKTDEDRIAKLADTTRAESQFSETESNDKATIIKGDEEADPLEDGDFEIKDANDEDYYEDKGSQDQEESESDQDQEEKLNQGEKEKEGADNNEENDDDDDDDNDDYDEGIPKANATKQRLSGTPKIKDENDILFHDDKNETKENENNQDEDDDEPYVPQTHTIVIPSYASWFDAKKIHPIEKESLPEFFTNQNPSKTPDIYANYRNFLINAYRLNPNDYLTITAARRNLVGDVGTILRLHRFLSKWGLINYQVDPSTKPKSVEPPFTGDYNVEYDSPRGLFPFESFKAPVEPYKLNKLNELLNADGNKRTITEVNSVDKKKGNLEEESSSDRSPRSFKKPRIMESINDGWSKEDLKKLLEGLTKFQSDWNKIAEHVGTHTPEQCIIRFLKLPIEDKYLADGNSKDTLGPLKYAPYLPYSQANNPVLSTVAFLVSLIDPEVVQAATSRAIKVMEQKDLEKLDELQSKSSLETRDEDGDENIEDNEEGDKSLNADISNEQPLADSLKEASKIALSAIGIRSHVYKTNEEIEMNKLTNIIVNSQLNKLELKLSKIDTIEKELDIERKFLQNKQEELFLDRLSFTKLSSEVISKFESLVSSFDGNKNEENSKTLGEIKELLQMPVRSQLTSFELSSASASRIGLSSEVPSINEGGSNKHQELNEKLNPVSIEAPQVYRYWSG